MRADGYPDAECCKLEDCLSFLMNDQLEFPYLPMHSFSSLLSSESSQTNEPNDELFEITDYLAFAEEGHEHHEMLPPAVQQNPPLQENTNHATEYESYHHKQVQNAYHATKYESYRHKQVLYVNLLPEALFLNRNEAKNSLKVKSSSKVAFKTKSEVDVIDDGYRWRKYGKKMVKDNPNPRNYYRCSNEGCNVKKRIQREQEDSRYLITMYEGIHNHQAPLMQKEIHK